MSTFLYPLPYLLSGIFVLLVAVHAGKDYYKILQVPRDAGERQIKKSFRKLSLKYHPDKNDPEDESAKKKFIELNEAFEVLSDPEKRQIYDQYGEEGVKQSNQGGGGGPRGFHGFQGGAGGEFSFEFGSDIFSQFFGGGMGGRRRAQQGQGHATGQDLFHDTPHVLKLSKNSWKQEIDASNDVLCVMFYSPTCSHCHAMKGAFSKVAKRLEGYTKFAGVDCSQHRSLCRNHGIEGYPTILFFGFREHSTPEEYEGDRSPRSLYDFVESRLPSFVIRLTKENLPAFSRRYWNTPRLLVLSSKENISPLLKALSRLFLDKVAIAMVKKEEIALIEEILGTSHDPKTASIVYQDIVAGQNEQPEPKNYNYKKSTSLAALSKYLKEMEKKRKGRKAPRRPKVGSKRQTRDARWHFLPNLESLPPKKWNVLYMASLTAEQDVPEALRNLPKQFATDPFEFYLLDTSSQPEQVSLFDGKPDHPLLVVYKPKNRKYVSMMWEQPTGEETTFFLNKILNGEQSFKRLPKDVDARDEL